VKEKWWSSGFGLCGGRVAEHRRQRRPEHSVEYGCFRIGIFILLFIGKKISLWQRHI